MSKCGRTFGFHSTDGTYKLAQVLRHDLPSVWPDWRNFATLDQSLESWAIFERLFSVWQNFEFTLTEKLCH